VRILDILLSILGILLLLPAMILIAIGIVMDAGWPIFFRQERVGRYGRPFLIWKFRTMTPDAEVEGLLTLGVLDTRVTRFGRWLRYRKLDELPQLWNVLSGNMSMVGPRPEVQKYVDYYTPVQRQILNLRPGITDHATLAYLNEEALLAASDDPEKTYIEDILPAKIRLNMQFILRPTPGHYLRILGQTCWRLLRG
jgi:lipopolysaccharide/colanic/teichoic acid biosynthesis glycosyltransferase